MGRSEQSNECYNRVNILDYPAVKKKEEKKIITLQKYPPMDIPHPFSQTESSPCEKGETGHRYLCDCRLYDETAVRTLAPSYVQLNWL